MKNAIIVLFFNALLASSISHALIGPKHVPPNTPPQPSHDNDSLMMRASPGKWGVVDLIGKRRGILGTKPNVVRIYRDPVAVDHGLNPLQRDELPSRILYDDSGTQVHAMRDMKILQPINDYLDIQDVRHNIDGKTALELYRAFILK